MKVVFVSTALAPYRLFLFESLGSQMCGELVVLTRSKGVESLALGYRIRNLSGILLRRSGKNAHGHSEEIRRFIPHRIIKILKEEKPNVVIAVNVGIRTLMVYFYCRFQKIPLILLSPLTEHSEVGRKKSQLLLRRFLFKRAAAVITNGRSGASYIHQLGCPKNKIFEIPYSTKNNLFLKIDPNRVPESRYRFLTVGQLVPRKGLIELAHALRKYLDQNPERKIEWTVVGSGPLRDEMISCRFHDRLKVNIIDHVPYERLPELYATHGIFVFPTLCDEWGVVVNEAMASAMPVIGSIYSGAVDELIRDGLNGWIIDPKRESSIFRAVDSFFTTDTDHLVEMAQNARSEISRCDSDYIARRFLEIINMVTRLGGPVN